MHTEFQKVIEMIRSEKHDLKSLAELTGRDIFRFYNGADLTGIDLSHQDLTGLNFDDADIRMSNLDSIKFDSGAFNNSIIDKSQSVIKDEYIFNSDDVIDFPSAEIILFARIRPRMIDVIIGLGGMNYTEFAYMADISVNALRKSRNNKVVSIETAQSIFKTLKSNSIGFSLDLNKYVQNIINQPCVLFLSGGNNSPFFGLKKEEVEQFITYHRVRNYGAAVQASERGTNVKT